MKGKFIVIEGLEGAGKTSAVNCVKTWLENQGQQVVLTREPGGTPLAEKLRIIVKQAINEVVTPQAELLLMYASRVQLVENIIKPALESGKWVVGDRHDLSSQAYQGGGRELGDGTLKQLKQIVLGDFKPDLTLYLDITPEVGLQRAKSRGELDRIEQESLDFFNRTRDKFIQLADADETIFTVDASRDIENVQQDIVNILMENL